MAYSVGGDPARVIRGNLMWRGGVHDREGVWSPCKNGKGGVSWLPPAEIRNNKTTKYGKWYPGNALVGVGGVDS